MLNINLRHLSYLALTLLVVGYAKTGECVLVDTENNAVTNETALGDIDMAKGTMGDLKEAIAPDYEAVSNAAMNAVQNALDASTNSVDLIDLMSSYGIASGASNDVAQMSFFGCLLTNNFTMAYDTSAQDENTWQWTLYAGDTSDVLASGTVESFSPFDDKSFTIQLNATAQEVYEVDSIQFQVGKSSHAASGIVREKDLTNIIYDDETDWMALYFKKQTIKYFPNSNQVENAIAKAVPTKVSQLANDSEYVTKSVTNGLATATSIPTDVSQLANGSGYATTNYVVETVSNAAFEVDHLTNIVRRTDKTFSLGTANTVGLFSTVVGGNNTLGNRSTVFGFNNTLLGPSAGNAQQYAFGLGNRSTAPNNFIAGIGSGAIAEDASYSISLGTMSVSTNLGSFVWNWYPTDYSSVQADEIFDLFPKYYSHGNGTFNVNPIGGLRGFWIGETNLEDHIIATAMEPIAAAASIVSDNLKDFVTNSLVVGYTDWKYTGSVSPTAVYSITMTDAGGGNYNFTLNDTVSVTTLGTVITNTLNPTMLVYETPGITASRDEIRRNQNGFAYYSDVKTLRDDVENMDTSYFHYSLQNTVTNVNQSVQYVNTDANTTQLEIKIPTSGMTKDWVIYVNPMADVSLILPPANYWVSDEATTNAIPAYTPTALYFSQINENTFSLGRKEFVPVTVPSPMMLSIQRARDKAKTKGKVGVRSATAQPVIKK